MKKAELINFLKKIHPYPDDVFMPKENGNDTFILDQIEILKEKSEVRSYE